MNARQALVCPSCGVLNRPTWEFCAKCGDSLEGATRTTTEREDDVVQQDAPAEVAGVPSTVVLGVAGLALAMLAAVAWRHVSEAEPAVGPDPAMFTIATLPPDLPEAPLPPSTPGSEAFEEGQQLARSGDLEGARDAFADAVGLDGSNPVYRTAYGRALWDLGGREQALSELGIASRLDPERQLAYARALDLAGSRRDAVEQYEEVLVRNPESAVVHEDLGRLLYRAGEYQTATEHLERAVEARPDDPVLRQELAYALDASGEKEAAERAYREVLDAAPEAVISRGLLAQNLYDQGRGDEALSVLQDGLQMSPDAPLLQRELGSVLERSGQRAEAAEAYRRYAQLAPNAPDAGDITERAARLEKGGASQ
jgi:Flp pilus assembly protein TadD